MVNHLLWRRKKTDLWSEMLRQQKQGWNKMQGPVFNIQTSYRLLDSEVIWIIFTLKCQKCTLSSVVLFCTHGSTVFLEYSLIIIKTWEVIILQHYTKLIHLKASVDVQEVKQVLSQMHNTYSIKQLQKLGARELIVSQNKPYMNIF